MSFIHTILSFKNMTTQDPRATANGHLNDYTTSALSKRYLHLKQNSRSSHTASGCHERTLSRTDTRHCISCALPSLFPVLFCVSWESASARSSISPSTTPSSTAPRCFIIVSRCRSLTLSLPGFSHSDKIFASLFPTLDVFGLSYSSALVRETILLCDGTLLRHVTHPRSIIFSSTLSRCLLPSASFLLICDEGCL